MENRWKFLLLILLLILRLRALITCPRSFWIANYSDGFPSDTPPANGRSIPAALLDVFLGRRSRRFAMGMEMPGGPLAYKSRHRPRPLTEEEEAALAFAAAGVTGHALADLCYVAGQGGNIMNGLVGRTAGSGDGIQSVALFVINDQGTWLMKRPREVPPAELAQAISLAGQRACTEIYRASRVQIQTGRAAPSLEPLFNINCNRWSALCAGHHLFSAGQRPDVSLHQRTAGNLQRNNRRLRARRAGGFPAGRPARFARSRGGHLDDDPRAGRVVTIALWSGWSPNSLRSNKG